MTDLKDLYGLLSAIAKGSPPSIARTTIDGFIISTVDSYDQGPETAIIDKNSTHPVERYIDSKLARSGHSKWVDSIKQGNRVVTKLGYGELSDDEEIILEPITDILKNEEE